MRGLCPIVTRVHRGVARPVERCARPALPPLWPLWTAPIMRARATARRQLIGHCGLKKFAAVEVAVESQCGHAPLAIHQMARRKAAGAHVQLHAIRTVASISGPAVAIATAAVQHSSPAVVLTGRPDPHHIAIPVPRVSWVGHLDH